MMRVRRLFVLATLPLAACSRRQPELPAPVLPDTAGEGARRAAELERQRQDSIARARAAEEEARRRAAETTARARAILDITSMGEGMPLDPRSNEEAWARNRRAEFTVTAGGDNLVLPGT